MSETATEEVETIDTPDGERVILHDGRQAVPVDDPYPRGVPLFPKTKVDKSGVPIVEPVESPTYPDTIAGVNDHLDRLLEGGDIGVYEAERTRIFDAELERADGGRKGILEGPHAEE